MQPLHRASTIVFDQGAMVNFVMRTLILLLALLTACSSQTSVVRTRSNSNSSTLPPVYIVGLEAVQVRRDQADRLRCMTGNIVECQCWGSVGKCVCRC